MNIEKIYYQVESAVIESVRDDMGWRAKNYLREVYTEELPKRQHVLYKYACSQSNNLKGETLARLYQDGISTAYCLALDPYYYNRPLKIESHEIAVMQENKKDLGINSSDVAKLLMNMNDQLRDFVGTLIDTNKETEANTAFLEGFGDVAMLVHSKIQAIQMQSNPAYRSFARRTRFF